MITFTVVNWFFSADCVTVLLSATYRYIERHPRILVNKSLFTSKAALIRVSCRFPNSRVDSCTFASLYYCWLTGFWRLFGSCQHFTSWCVCLKLQIFHSLHNSFLDLLSFRDTFAKPKYVKIFKVGSFSCKTILSFLEIKIALFFHCWAVKSLSDDYWVLYQRPEHVSLLIWKLLVSSGTLHHQCVIKGSHLAFFCHLPHISVLITSDKSSCSHMYIFKIQHSLLLPIFELSIQTLYIL